MARDQEGGAPILQSRRGRNAWSILSYSPVTFSAFGDGLLHGPGRAGRQEGLPELELELDPEPEPKLVQLPTVWNP